MSPTPSDSRQAQHGKKMIEVRIRFWTNDIADEKDRIKPKHAWDSGVVLMQSNPSHGISPNSPLPFYSLSDLPAKMEKVLIDHGIKLHLSRKPKRYMVTD